MPVYHPSTEEEYNRLKLKNSTEELVVVKFSAEWCGPCKKIAPFYEACSETFEGTFIHVDVDVLADIPDCQDIRGVPTFKFFKDGGLQKEFSGASEKKLEQYIREFQ